MTGTTGRVGRLLCRHWQVAPAKADVVFTQRGQGPGISWDPLLSLPGLGLGRFSCLVGLAGVTPAPGARLVDNVGLAQATLEAAHAAGIRRVLLASSSAVYGLPLHPSGAIEGDSAKPMNAYGTAKLAMEQRCDDWRSRGLEVCCMRIGNVAGADLLLTNSLQARPKEPLLLDQFSNGLGPRRSYIGAATLARVIETLATCEGLLPAVLNVAAPEPVAMADLVSAAGVPMQWVPAAKGAVQDITLDCRRLCTFHAFGPTESEAAEMIRQWHDLREPA